MPTPILVTKLFVPPGVPQAVARPRLVAQLDSGLARKLTLLCAPAGFGKSSLLAEWAARCPRRCVWVSLDPAEQDLQQFLAYLVAALQTVDASIGASAWALLQATPPPSASAVLTALINSVARYPEALLLVLDDYHLVSGKAVDEALAFLIDHLPPQLHLALATREEPALALARLRVHGQVTELRQQDLRFAADEATTFLAQTMALQLSAAHVAVLAARTEGWVAGLQLAAISLQGHPDPDQFIQSFTGSHRHLQDFLLAEVLLRQPPAVQTFLLRTAVLDRLCGALCDAVTQGNNSQDTLAYLEQANLFVVPLDTERRWFRYHHLFAELLRQRLQQHEPAAPLLIRASEWYEAQGQAVDALQQAIAAADIGRAIRLIDGDGMPLYFRGAMTPVIQWLQHQPQHLLDQYPRLWVMLAWSLMIAGYPTQMALKLQGAQAVLQRSADTANTADTRDLRGQIAALQAWAAVAKGDVATIHAAAAQALALLPADNPACRTAARCAQGAAYQFEGQRAAAKQAYEQVLSTGQRSGNFMFVVVASTALAGLQLSDNQLHLAAKTYRDILQRLVDPSHSIASETHLGLARICYEWNDLDAAAAHARRSSQLAAPMESGAGLSADALYAQVLQVRQQGADATALLARTAVAAQTRGFASRVAEIAGLQAQDLLRRGEPAAALALAQRHQLPVATAMAWLAQGDAAQALLILTAHRAHMEQSGRADESLKARVAQALALDALGQLDNALQVLHDALLLGEPGGLVRTFVDLGPAMARLVAKLAARGTLPDYTAKLLAAWGLAAAPASGADADTATDAAAAAAAATATAQLLQLGLEPLSLRELDILRLIQQGKSNQEVGQALFLSLHTVKWHNQNIFDKLQVKRRTEAVARALALNLLRP